MTVLTTVGYYSPNSVLSYRDYLFRRGSGSSSVGQTGRRVSSTKRGLSDSCRSGVTFGFLHKVSRFVVYPGSDLRSSLLDLSQGNLILNLFRVCVFHSCTEFFCLSVYRSGLRVNFFMSSRSMGRWFKNDLFLSSSGIWRVYFHIDTFF